ncbi:MAG: YqgE/AlgH family protein [Isosphaeraceae bacterium]
MNSLKGHLLIATPRLLDPNFARTVLLIFEHTAGGAAGLVLNRSTEMSVTDISGQLLDDAVEWDKIIHLGGPVPGPLMALHADADLADQEAFDGLYLSVAAEKIRTILESRLEPSLLLANYAGWGPGQLDRELAEDSWYHFPASAEQVFWDEADDLWERSIRTVNRQRTADLIGEDELPEDPSLN